MFEKIKNFFSSIDNSIKETNKKYKIYQHPRKDEAVLEDKLNEFAKDGWVVLTVLSTDTFNIHFLLQRNY